MAVQDWITFAVTVVLTIVLVVSNRKGGDPAEWPGPSPGSTQPFPLSPLPADHRGG